MKVVDKGLFVDHREEDGGKLLERRHSKAMWAII